MPRLIASILCACLCACGGPAFTRVFLHGEVVGEDGQPQPHAVVRLGSRETLADDRGHYRFLYLRECLSGDALAHLLKNDELEAFFPARPVARMTIQFGLACHKDTEKYLRLTFPKHEPGNEQ